MSLTSYNFYNKDWFIAADVVKHYNLSSSYNTYYSKYYSNGRLYGPVPSYEFRLSGEYLNEFKTLYGANNPSLIKSNAVWLIDQETVDKLINKDNIKSKEKTVKTVESNALSIKYNLGLVKVNSPNNDEYIVNPLWIKDGIIYESKAAVDKASNIHTDNNISIMSNKTINKEVLEKELKELTKESTIVADNYTNSPYSEEDISDAITLISSKLTNSPYQQEKILDGGGIRLDLFTCTRRSAYAVELKKNTITLDHVKEKLDTKNYLTHIIKAYPDLSITFIFSSPKGITFDALMYLQEASKSIGEHKVIYKPTSNLLLDMINKKEKDLPSYYYKQILDKPIIKYLLQVS